MEASEIIKRRVVRLRLQEIDVIESVHVRSEYLVNDVASDLKSTLVDAKRDFGILRGIEPLLRKIQKREM